MHLLSIIMPVYNVEKYVADTIEGKRFQGTFLLSAYKSRSF